MARKNATFHFPVSKPMASEEEPRAKNVILFIGDGMGISTITAARIYEGQKRGESGEENVLSFETFDNVALVKTYNTNAQVPDSAVTATAMHSGSKTRIGVLGIGPDASRGSCADALAHPLPLLGEEVKSRGLALGIVSTARITHATPASVYARSPDRNWESDAAIPPDEASLGCKDIATQLVESNWDVALGGGLGAFFGSEMGGRRGCCALRARAQCKENPSAGGRWHWGSYLAFVTLGQDGSFAGQGQQGGNP